MPEALKLNLAVKTRSVCVLIFSARQTRSDVVHGWAAKETNLNEVLLHSGIQHDNRSLDRVTMVYCNKRNYKNATKICNPHPGLPSGERRQPGMLLLGPWCRISATMSQSNNELSSGRAISGSVALNANEEARGGARWRVGVALTSLRPLYHVLMLTVDVSQWLIDMQSLKRFSLTQNLIRMKKLQLSGYSRTSPNG
ncbi:hypothetical protein DPX16_18896 [Anabarilius grahami]|uniref:Uncharacterized protein n=1 Tax=Anabarilius grahami TaxID=495550 RepID=A0A3N0YMX5_ANAGA|nr:hypothetical protein DPX16_18896 [Anabarilius grahami]